MATLHTAMWIGLVFGGAIAGWIMVVGQTLYEGKATAYFLAALLTIMCGPVWLFVRHLRNRAREELRLHRERLAMPSAHLWRPCVIESPYAGETDEEIDHNLRYLRAAMNWCLHHGYAPFASHGLYTQPGVLRDEVPEERRLGIEAGKAVGKLLPVRLVFTDLGVTSVMQEVLDDPVPEQVVRTVELGKDWHSRMVVRRWRGHRLGRILCDDLEESPQRVATDNAEP